MPFAPPFCFPVFLSPIGIGGLRRLGSPVALQRLARAVTFPVIYGIMTAHHYFDTRSLMQSGSNDISFTLFGFPTTIQPFFWLIAAVITALHLGQIDEMPIWIAQMFLGMVAVLISILVHELGHALVFRHVFHTPCTLVLHGFGGLTMPLHHYRHSYGIRGTIARCFLSFAGPLAGFILAALMMAIIFVVPIDNGGFVSKLLFYFCEWMVWISIVWGIFNLLPIYPMDGGHISREFFLFFFPRRGKEFSLYVSIMLASLLAILALQHGMFFITFLFGFFAYQNYQELNFRSF